MSVTTVVDRLALILAAVDGVPEGGVFAGRPDDVMPAMTPAFLILTGGSSYDYGTEGMDDIAIDTRTYRLILMVQSWVEGSELQAEQNARPFFDAMRTCFMDRPTLEYPGKTDAPLSGVQEARLTGDTGVINVVVAGVAYSGVEWALEVKEYVRRRFA